MAFGFKVVNKTDYQRLQADRDALSNNIITLHTKVENIRRECNKTEQTLLDEIDRLKKQIAEYQSFQFMAKRIDRAGLLDICRSHCNWITDIREEEKSFILQYGATNACGDRVRLVLPKVSMQCQRLSQLAEFLTPHEFPELTEAYNLDAGISGLRCRYIPFHEYWWRRRDEDKNTIGTAMDFYIRILKSSAEYSEDPLGFLLIIDKLQEPKDNKQLTENINGYILERLVWVGSERKSEPLVLSTNDVEIYVIAPHSSDKPLDLAALSGSDSRRENHRWLKANNELFEAYIARWKLTI